MAAVTSPTWIKQSCFDTLQTNVYHLIKGDHKMADIINMVMEELWAHKPHTKRPDREKASSPVPSTVYQSQTGNNKNMINSMNGRYVNSNQNYQNYQNY